MLEMFYWRRVVFDEFHELESFESAQQNSLQFLRSHFRWGLTGTPPVDNNAGAIFMSSLFRVDLPGFLMDGPGYSNVDLSCWEAEHSPFSSRSSIAELFLKALKTHSVK